MKSYDAPCAGTVQIMGHQKNPARTADMVEIWILSVKRGKTSRITEKTCSRILHPETLVQTKSKFFDRITNSSPLAADVATRGSIAGKRVQMKVFFCGKRYLVEGHFSRGLACHIALRSKERTQGGCLGCRHPQHNGTSPSPCRGVTSGARQAQGAGGNHTIWNFNYIILLRMIWLSGWA